MTTLEKTISLIKILPEADLLKVQEFAQSLSTNRKMKDGVPILSKEEFLKSIARSEAQFANGEYKEMGQVLEEIRLKYAS